MSAAKTSAFDTSMKWGKMNVIQRMSFMFKFVITLCTFGFVFPNVMD